MSIEAETPQVRPKLGDLLTPGSSWKHRNGCNYTILFLVNAANEDRYPLTVVYQGANGNLWSRRADDWFRSMTPLRPTHSISALTPGSYWESVRGNIFSVLFLANEGGEHPLTVIYQSANGKAWTMPADLWLHYMKPLTPTPAPEPADPT